MTTVNPGNFKSLLERLSSHLALMTVTMVLINYYSLYNYYNRVGIEIYNYINVSEIIFHLSPVYSLILSFIGSALIGYYMRTSRENTDPAQREKKWYDKPVIKVLINMIIFVTVIYAPQLLNYFFHWQDDELYFILQALCLAGAQIYTFRSSRLYTTGLVFAFTVSAFIGYINNRNTQRYTNLISKKPKYYVELKKYNSTELIKSNDSTSIYVGSTQEYFFFLNHKDSVVSILRNKDFEEISIRELRKGL
jgi:hypothetical protein